MILHSADRVVASALEFHTSIPPYRRPDVAVAAKVGTGGAFGCRGDVVHDECAKVTSPLLHTAALASDDSVNSPDLAT